MRWILFYLSLLVLFIQSDKLAYGISRLYEGIFVYFQYNYYGIEKEGFHKELGFHKKVVCKDEDYTPEMAKFLHGKMERGESKLLSKRKRKEAYQVTLSGKEYVVKSHRQRGVIKNFLQMGKAVTIWNNLIWAEEKKLPVQDAVAFVETRGWGKVITHVLYRYEGTGVNYMIQDEKFITPLVTEAIELLKKKRVIHQDLRARNMIYVKEKGIKFIDIDILHYYPKWSLIYHKRMKEEKRLFKEDCPAYVTDSQSY